MKSSSSTNLNSIISEGQRLFQAGYRKFGSVGQTELHELLHNTEQDLKKDAHKQLLELANGCTERFKTNWKIALDLGFSKTQLVFNNATLFAYAANVHGGDVYIDSDTSPCYICHFFCRNLSRDDQSVVIYKLLVAGEIAAVPSDPKQKQE